MKALETFRILSLLLVLLLAGILPCTAAVYFQCPGYNAAVDADIVPPGGDGMLRASDGEISNPISSTEVCMHLAAGDGFIQMADGEPQYIFGFTNVTGIPDEDVMNMWNHPTNPGGMLGMNFSAPRIELREGEELYLTLTNVGMMMRPDLFDPHTVHYHGFPNASAIFDGVPDASIAINMGSSLTYYYNNVEPGTFMYHCHVEATEHMQMGMLGNLYVTPAIDTALTKYAYDITTPYNVVKHLQIVSFDPEFHKASLAVQPLPFALMEDKYPMLNGRGYPDTVNPDPIVFNHPDFPEMIGHEGQKDSSLIIANSGDRILLRISSLSTTSFHTLTALGLPMQVVGTGARKLGPAGDVRQYYNTTSVTIGGGQAIDVILDTTGVPAGTYFLYATNLDHLNNNKEEFGGMMTEIVLQ